jgi:hypothetical protein
MPIISFLPTSLSVGSSEARRPPLARAAGRRGEPGWGLVTKRAGGNSLEGAAGMELMGKLPRAVARVSAGGATIHFKLIL